LRFNLLLVSISVVRSRAASIADFLSLPPICEKCRRVVVSARYPSLCAKIRSLTLPRQLEGEDSTPVRGALYEPATLLGESAEPRLSQIRAGVVVWGAFLWKPSVQSATVGIDRTTTTIKYTKQRPFQLEFKTESPSHKGRTTLLASYTPYAALAPSGASEAEFSMSHFFLQSRKSCHDLPTYLPTCRPTNQPTNRPTVSSSRVSMPFR
jgi:hypothetical protein